MIGRKYGFSFIFVNYISMVLFLFLFKFTNLFSFSQIIYGLKETNGSLTIPFDVFSIDPNTASSNIEISTNSLVPGAT